MCTSPILVNVLSSDSTNNVADISYVPPFNYSHLIIIINKK